MCDDNMDIITVLRDTIDVRDGFETCAYYSNNDVEDVINDICLNWNVKLTGGFFIVPLFLLQCVIKDIIIIQTIVQYKLQWNLQRMDIWLERTHWDGLLVEINHHNYQLGE